MKYIYKKKYLIQGKVNKSNNSKNNNKKKTQNYDARGGLSNHSNLTLSF